MLCVFVVVLVFCGWLLSVVRGSSVCCVLLVVGLLFVVDCSVLRVVV